MFTGEFEDVSELNDQVTRKLVYASPPDVINATDTQIHDVMVRADSCQFDDFDLKNIWVTDKRWNMLIIQYIDPLALTAWLEMIETKLFSPRKRGIAFMRTNSVKSHINPSTGRVWRVWGSCLLGLAYKSRPRPHISLHSRTSYLGYLTEIDLAVAVVLAREIGQRLNLDLADIGFTWHLDVGQFHAFKSLPWFFKQPDDQELLMNVKSGKELKKKWATVNLARRTLEKFWVDDENGKGYGEHNYQQMLRLRRRYHAEITGGGEQYAHGTTGRAGVRNRTAFPPLPSVTLDDLDLMPVLRRHGGDANNAGMIEEDNESV